MADSDQADTATSASSAANADTLDGKDSSDFQASNPCSRWVSATQHNDGGSAYQFDTATGEIQPVPRF